VTKVMLGETLVRLKSDRNETGVMLGKTIAKV